jgi:hypothetical protein
MAISLAPVLPESLAAQVRRLGERYGIRNIRVFGSFARNQAGPDSDLDLLVEYVPGQSGFAFVRFCREVEELVGRKVDVATDRSLHPLRRCQQLSQPLWGVSAA